jgi:hypothetical protein
MAELLAPAQAAVDAVARGADPEAAAAAAEADALSAAARPLLDEFGRDVNAYRRDRASMRAAARRDALAVLTEHTDGDVSAAVLLDDSALEEVALVGVERAAESGGTSHYARRVSDLLLVARDVFADVAPEFSTLAAVLERLLDFKARFPAQYGAAFVSEALPALTSVFTRLELLQWDPLHGGGQEAGLQPLQVRQFEEQKWFSELFKFSAAGADTDICYTTFYSVALCWGNASLCRSGLCAATAALVRPCCVGSPDPRPRLLLPPSVVA